jgi:hypothetical protein
MALKVNHISATELLHIVRPDFTKNKWDGCLRMSHQFIPFIQKLFDTAGISYILELTPANEPRIPYLERPDLAYDVRDNDIHIQGVVFTAFAAQRDANAAVTMQMELARQAIRDNPANAGNPGLIAAQIFAIGANTYVPMYLAPQAQCNTGLHNAIKIYEESMEKHQIAADKAMTIIQSNLGETMLEQIAELVQQVLPANYTQRHKVIGLWQFLRGYRQANPQIISDIRTDFGRMTQLQSFAEAKHAVTICNHLQLQLTTMGPNLQKTDSELVTIMTNIMVDIRFNAIKLEVLQRDQRMDTIQKAPLLGIAAPAQPNILAGVAVALQGLGVILPHNFLEAGVPQRQPMTWTQLCALIDQSTIMDPTHGVHSTLSVKRGAYICQLCVIIFIVIILSVSSNRGT